MSPKDQEEASAAFAQAIFACNLPHSLFENPLWQRAFSKLRPAFKPPKKSIVGDKLLTSEFERVQTAVQSKINSAVSVSVTCDGWKNIRGEHLMNFVVCTPEPVFHSIVEPKENREDAEYIRGEMRKVINEVGPMKVYVVGTDNAANCKSAGRLIEEEFPHITHVGCCAHAIDLFIEDIVGLPPVQRICAICRALVKKVKNVSVILSHFQKYQEEQSARTKTNSVSLKLPSATRFAGVVILFKCVILNKQALQQTILVPELNVDRKIKEFALSDDKFWSKLVAWYGVLEPVARAIAYVEGDFARLSDAVEAFHVISVDSVKAFQSSPIKKYEGKFKEMLTRRQSFVLKSVHYAANLLDPRYRGHSLDAIQKSDGLDYITTMSGHLGLDVAKILANFAEFKTGTGLWSRESLFASSELLPPSVWWQAHCSDEALFPVANRLLNLPPSSGACERVWSGFGRCHTKKRNRLKNKKVAMEVFVQMNMPLIDPSLKKQKSSSKPLRPMSSGEGSSIASAEGSEVARDVELSDTDVDSDSGDEASDSDWEENVPSSSSESDEEETQLDKAKETGHVHAGRKRTVSPVQEKTQRRLRKRR